MTAITATLMMPVVAILAGICSLAFGISPHAIVSFGDAFYEPVGLLVWWAAALVPASAYAVFCVRNAN